MGLTGKVVPYKKNFGISPPGIFHLPFPAASFDTTVEDTLRALQVIFRADIDPSQVAAIIVEPILGEGGFLEAPAELLRALRALCDEHGIVLIADEVQSGFARTGKMFAMEHSGVRPDLVTVAKSLAGGFPLSGVIGRKALMDAVAPGALGGTYAGSPVACAAALAVLDVIEEEGLVERADVIGATIKGAIEDVSQQNDAVGISSVRGRGAMIAFDIVKHRGTSPLADPDTTKKVTRAALSAGLVLLSCGVHGNTIRLLNPLTISDDVLAEGLRLLAGALIVGGNESA
jgi:4-aminobutyrate aminotransferase/(S)-3-amino-2-methylpropionate transaminase